MFRVFRFETFVYSKEKKSKSKNMIKIGLEGDYLKFFYNYIQFIEKF